MLSKKMIRTLKKAHGEVAAAPTAGQTRGEGQSTTVVERIEASTSQAEFDVYLPAADNAGAFLVVVIIAFCYVSGPPLALLGLVNYLHDKNASSSFYTEMGVSPNFHHGVQTELLEAFFEYMDATRTEINIDVEILADIASNNVSGAILSIACCMIMLVAAKQQVTAHAVTYVNRRLVVFLQSQRGFIPEADALFGTNPRFPAPLVEGISTIARANPAICKMLLGMVQGLAESSRGDISKAAEVTLTLVSFAQATPLILATRFALPCPAVAKI